MWSPNTKLPAIDLHKNEHKYVYIMGKGSRGIGSAKKMEPGDGEDRKGTSVNDKGTKRRRREGVV